MHLVYPPEFCITIVSNFSWVLQSSQEKSKTIDMQFFFREGGGGTRCIMVYVKMVNSLRIQPSLLATREVSPRGTSAPHGGQKQEETNPIQARSQTKSDKMIQKKKS